ncbi:hypothetical protein QAD02_020369 [Eretmocerus hayati]|uniref:Uncharacterized protein n=1 Tax=Eretmocerus hayati TaxID=131215 RepID=A0ACC2PMG5_9HYME|nr:hypothetical protein QAD02_020369 [Eretmocerus hayati]
MSVADERVGDLNKNFLNFMSEPKSVESATEEIYEDLLEEVLMGFVFDIHRMIRTGSSDVEEGIPDDESFTIVGKFTACNGPLVFFNLTHSFPHGFFLRDASIDTSIRY